MNIQIDDYYRITTSDRYNVTIESRADREPTEENTEPFTNWGNGQYYGSVESACIALLKLMVNTGEAKTIEELKIHTTNCTEKIIKAIQNKVPKIE